MKEGRERERERGYFLLLLAFPRKEEGGFLVHLEIFIGSGRCQGAFGVFGKHDYYDSDRRLPC